jgi:5-methylcytosine-specific restriction endonuclease McrA
MRDYGVISPKWTDHLGREWIEPQIKGRLKMRVPAHLALREFVIHRAAGKCEKCGSTNNLVADHVVSRRNGGRHHPDNMQCLCQHCNSAKVGLVDSKVGRYA